MALVIPPPEVLLLTFVDVADAFMFDEVVGDEKYALKSGCIKLADELDMDEDDPLVALVKRLFSMSAAFGATLTFACRSRLDCEVDEFPPEFRFELSRFRELFEFVSREFAFSIEVKDPPDIDPYIGPNRELRFGVLDMYCESMLELAAA